MLKMTKEKAQIGCQKKILRKKWGEGGGGGEGGEKEGKNKEKE